MRILAMFCVAFLFPLAANCSAAIITSPADPALTGATIETFNGAPLGSSSNLVLGNVTVSMSGGAFTVDNWTVNGAFVPPNPPGDQHILAGGNLLTFTFAAPTGAFGIQIGATNSPQTLTAYDAGGNVIQSLIIPNQVATLPYPYTGFYGISSGSSNIAYFTVTNNSDAVVYDDLYLAAAAPVPEPASMLAWSLIVGVGAIGYRMRKRKGTAV